MAAEVAIDAGVPIVEKKYLKAKDYITFSMARFATAAISGLVQGYLLIFYTSVLGIDPLKVGTMFLIAKIWDGINDPIMGVIVDKTRSKMGKMRPYLLYGAVPFGLVIIAMFLPLGGVLSSVGKVAFMYASYLLYDFLSTLVGVPLDGLPAVASPNPEERAKIISVSRIVGSIGEQSGLVLYSLFIIFMPMKDTFLMMGLVIGIAAPVFMILGGLNVKERIKPTGENVHILDGFKYMFQNKQFLVLILGLLLTFFRNLVSAMQIYMVTYIYGDGSLNIAFALPGAIASMIGMLFAPWLKKRMDAKKLFILSTIVHSVMLVIVYLIGYQVHWIVTAAVMFFAMLPVGIINVAPHLMVIDTLDYWEDKTGKRQEGIAFAIVSLRSKISSAFKDYFIAFLLATFLFATPLTSAVNDHSPWQLQTTLDGLFMMFTVIPAVLNLVCIVPFLFYTLSGKRMAEINARLAFKRMMEDGGVNAEESGEGKTVGWLSLDDLVRDPADAKNPDAAFGVVGRMSLDDLVACPVVCATEETEIKASEENAPCDEEIFVLEGCEPTTEEEKIALAEKQAVDEYEKGGDL